MPCGACRGGVVLRGIDLDQTGFREALLVDGPSSACPLIQGCSLKCSGDDAVNTGGAGVWASLSLLPQLPLFLYSPIAPI